MGSQQGQTPHPDRAQVSPEFWRQALASRPDDAQLWMKLGLAYLQQQQAPQALEALHQGLQRAPQEAEFHYLLGLVLEHLGQGAQAHRAYVQFLRQVDRSKQVLLAICHLGRVAMQMGRYAKAFVYYELVLKLYPAWPRAINQLGLLYAEEQALDQAQLCFEAVFSLPPESALPLRSGASFFQTLNTAEAPQQVRQRWLALSAEALQERLGVVPAPLPDSLQRLSLVQRSGTHLDSLVRLAEILEKRGELNLAYALVQPLVTTGLHASLLAVYGQICLDLQRPQEAEPLLTALLKSPAQVHPELLRPLFFLLGEMAEHRMDPAQAFAYFAQGNRFRAGRFDRQKFRENLDLLLEVFTPDLLERLPAIQAQVPDSAKLIFIFGMPRSGTTLVEQILASHSAVCGGGELRFMGDVWRRLQHHFGRAVAVWRKGLLAYSATELAALAQEYLSRATALIKEGEFYLTDKMPSNFFCLPLLSKLFPQAHFIHVQRDPLDTCWSCFRQNFEQQDFAADLEDIGLYYWGYRRVMRRWSEILSVPILTLKYEELVLEPERMTRQLLNHCGLEWEETCLDFHLNRRQIHTASYAQVRQPLSLDSLGRSQPYLPYLEPLLKWLNQDNNSGV